MSQQGSWGSISVEADGKCNVLGKCQFVVERRKEINEKEIKETVAKLNKTKSWFFEKINKINP